MIYFHILVMITAMLICYKWGDWRSWIKYYSTIQFFIMGDMIYCILFRNNLFWMYVTDILNHTLINILIMAIVYPSIILVFIPYFPKGIFKQILYILLWSSLVAVTEFIAYNLGCFAYANGWNLGWSIVFSLTMFALIYLHYKKPLLAWIVAIAELAIFIAIFKVDIISLV